MGVVNVTPDSFSDGGLHLDPESAAAAARRAIDEGAAIVDIGGESTRPGADAVPLDEELRRVLPVIEELAGLPVSIDTAKAEVARRALESGAAMVNDITALRGDPLLASVVAGAGAHVCLMHMQGEPRTMQDAPSYEDVVSEVASFLEERLVFAVAQGIPEDLICLDPGIGFGKTPDQNLELVRRLDVLVALGRPVLVGLSRKSNSKIGTRLVDSHAARVARPEPIKRSHVEHRREAPRRPGRPRRQRRRIGRCRGGRVRPRRVDLPRPRRSPACRGARRRGGGGAGYGGRMNVELSGLEVYGFHGVLAEERQHGQRFLVDVVVVPLEDLAARTDDIRDAVDYRTIVAAVQEVSGGHTFHLLEAFCAARPLRASSSARPQA